MLPRVYFLNLIFTLFASAAGGDTELTAEYQGVVERLSMAVLREVTSKDLPAFSIALVEGDKTIWAEGYGFEDADRKRPASAETIYRVGSVSKLFTDIAVMQLADQEKLNLDTPVKQYLPSFAPRNESGIAITLRQLMSHQSGTP